MPTITVSEAAALLGVRPDMIRHWLRRGWLPKARKAGRVWLLDQEEVRAFQPPKVGWPEGQSRCPRCREKMEHNHKCTGG
ncbi:MAG: helix-turn-helix domain-containing protein [Planctomycetota bacterium]|jgi:excisionase family DNA binding protein